MTRAELRAYTRRLLAEQNAAESFWSDADLNDFLNRAQEQVAVLAELLHCNSLANSEAGVQQYLQPRDILRVQRVFYKHPQTGEWLTLTYRSPDELDVAFPGWADAVASPGETPTWWTMRGQIVHLVPAPAETATQNIRLWGVQTPPPLVTDTEEPTFPLGYHEAVAIGAAIRALAADRTNPDNQRTIVGVLQPLFMAQVLAAKAQHQRKAPYETRLRDVRDFYSTDSGWRV
jgi:hypothetical protein